MADVLIKDKHSSWLTQLEDHCNRQDCDSRPDGDACQACWVGEVIRDLKNELGIE